MLKAFAFRLRGDRKDAYDLDYILASWPAGVENVADRMVLHAAVDSDTVAEALGHLREDYATIDHVGPRAAARILDSGNDDAAAADAQGRVADLLRACDARGVRMGPGGATDRQ